MNALSRSRGSLGVTLSTTEHLELQAAVHSGATPLALRASIVLLAAAGVPNTDISKTIGVSLPTVGKWLQRYRDQGCYGLTNRRRGTTDNTQQTVERVLIATFVGSGGSATRPTVRGVASRVALSKSAVGRVWKQLGLDLSDWPALRESLPTVPPLGSLLGLSVGRGIAAVSYSPIFFHPSDAQRPAHPASLHRPYHRGPQSAFLALSQRLLSASPPSSYATSLPPSLNWAYPEPRSDTPTCIVVCGARRDATPPPGTRIVHIDHFVTWSALIGSMCTTALRSGKLPQQYAANALLVDVARFLARSRPREQTFVWSRNSNCS